MSDRYAVVDDNDKVVNVVMWDGESDFPLAEQYRMIRVEPDEQIEPGGRRLSDGGWERAPRPQEETS